MKHIYQLNIGFCVVTNLNWNVNCFTEKPTKPEKSSGAHTALIDQIQSGIRLRSSPLGYKIRHPNRGMILQWSPVQTDPRISMYPSSFNHSPSKIFAYITADETLVFVQNRQVDIKPCTVIEYCRIRHTALPQGDLLLFQPARNTTNQSRNL